MPNTNSTWKPPGNQGGFVNIGLFFFAKHAAADSVERNWANRQTRNASTHRL